MLVKYFALLKVMNDLYWHLDSIPSKVRQITSWSFNTIDKVIVMYKSTS